MLRAGRVLLDGWRGGAGGAVDHAAFDGALIY